MKGDSVSSSGAPLPSTTQRMSKNLDQGSIPRRKGHNSKKSSSSSTVSSSSNNTTASSRFSFHESEYSCKSASHLSDYSDTHTLLKKAAQAALFDETTPTGSGTIFSSGDASDDDESNHDQTTENIPNMKSLETPSLPAIPDEQDRKRFVGCLAAVLSSMYDYESKELEREPEKPSDNDVSGFFDFYESSDEETTNAPPLKQTKSQVGSNDTSNNFYSRRCQSFESIGSSSTAANTRQPASLKPMLRRQAAAAQQSKTTNEKMRLSRQRYLSRRYELYSGLLLMSSELLLLDKSIARAFLPMLSRVLVPQIHRTKACDDADPDPSEESTNQIHLLDNAEELSPFLDSLTPGSGFRCVSLLLLQHLLTSENGYDARIRHPLKKLSILVLERDIEDDELEDSLGDQTAKRRKLLRATRKFEALEQNIARRLILLSSPSQTKKSKADALDKNNRDRSGDPKSLTRDQIVRGVKIGGAGILAGTLFAVTGGLAAPGIAAGVAAVAGAAAGTAAVSALTSAAVVTTIFGVGGGGLAAYKMQRRTQGVTEFEFCRETKGRPDRRGEDKIEAELFSILCISGWLRDECDYQRPWGLQPTHPRISDRLEKLERFYSIYSPDHLPKCERILSSWRGEEDELWKVLREKYGRDPDHLFPLENIHSNGNNVVKGQGALTLEQEEVLDKLFIELGYHSVAPEREQSAQHETQMSPFEKIRKGWKNRKHGKQTTSHDQSDSLHEPLSSQRATVRPNTSDSMLYSYESSGESQEEINPYKTPKHLSTVWDWKKTYGGEMYTVKWESELLTQICDCVTDLAVDVVTGATRQILKQTVLHTLLSAVVWPTYLLNLAHMIDGDWTIAVERADEAGVVLAKTLLYSRAGRRPVTLVGYSFGARIIYSCLKELARYQEEWEHYQELLEECNNTPKGSNHKLGKYQKKMKGMREPASIVEDAILLGLPNHLSLSSWKACRQVVAGRLVNCYSNNDLILSLMFQAKRFSGGSLNNGMGSFLKPVCGTCPVEEAGVENVDCSDIILGHQDYCLEIGRVLHRIGFGEPIRYIGEAASPSNEK